MKKLAPLAILLALVVLASCRSAHFRQDGPIDAFSFASTANAQLAQNVSGAIAERADPKSINLVVPPGTALDRLVATLALKTEGTITVVSSGERVVQENGRTPNDFSVPVMYAIELPGEDEPWMYRVSVREAETDAVLASIGVAGDSVLVPAFAANVRSYVAEVPFAAQSVALALRARSRFLESIVVDGTAYRGAVVQAQVPFSADEQLVAIETLAEDGISREQYEVTVVRGAPDRNNLLGRLDVPGIELRPVFDPQQRDYQLIVPYSAQQMRLSARAQSEFASIEVSSEIEAAGGTRSIGAIRGGLTDEGGAILAFAAGERMRVAVQVVAQDDSARTYRIVVERAEPDRDNALAVLSLLSADMRPQFRPAQMEYRVQVPFATNRFYLMARPRSAQASVSLQGAEVRDGQLSAAEGAAVDFANLEQLFLVLSVTAEDGGVRDYQLAIRRGPPDNNTALAMLDVSQGVLRPRFSPSTASYTVRLPAQAEDVAITALTASPVATVAEADTPGAASGEHTVLVAVEPGQSKVVSLVVIAEDGSQRLYRVAIPRPQSGGGQATDESTGPSTGTASGLAPFTGELTVRSKGALRLEQRELAALAAADAQLETTALVTIRYYRTDRVLLEDTVPIQVRQRAETATVTLNYTARGIAVEPDRLLEVEVVIPTSGGGSVYYTEALMTDPKMELDIPFLLYGESPRVQWPPIGEPVQLAGFVSRLTELLRAQEEDKLERNEKGEYGTFVQLTDASGTELVRENIWRNPGQARGHVVTFDQPVSIAEGATVRYRLSTRNRGGVERVATGTARVWSTQLDYDGGFQPARLFILEEVD